MVRSNTPHDRKDGMAREKRTIRYDDDVWALLESHAKVTGRPVTTIVNDVLRQHLTSLPLTIDDRLSALENRVAVLEGRLISGQ